MSGNRARGFGSFVAGAGGRLLHAATLLTAETPDGNPRARRLLVSALARTYAGWDQLRDEDPYDHARRELAARFALGSWRFHRSRGGLLGALHPRERLVLVLRLYEGLPEEQTAALLGLSAERIRTICHRAVATVHTPGAG
ncbi:sigma factor-like helix-turn-helix DNA-binding protein [Streptomyces qinzhouensis]|uniref:RNA polymerase n=1 Tax=Streptomyces qinzhouensis TaxID=2599401 RepID=A0A5B8IR90_9ACTN|nr:sigma factor-like helix-turn-helix DNA-binding protein [Streptomyces qinzhouensis]QDY81208.1 RNA polymerase [Streptomyces qinzhouensis]